MEANISKNIVLTNVFISCIITHYPKTFNNKKLQYFEIKKSKPADMQICLFIFF